MIFAALLAAAIAAPAQLDSEIVLHRYARALMTAPTPRVLVFLYTVSQAGPYDIEQTHRIYRSGELVRDETLLVDGTKQKTIRIARYANRYTLENLAPRLGQYDFLFDGIQKSGSAYQYAYRAIAANPSAGFAIDSMVIDGRTFLPVLLRFHSVSPGGTRGTGTIAFGRSGKYWVPQSANVEASVGGKRAREHIAFSAYRFPASLPKSTFQTPKLLPATALPGT